MVLHDVILPLSVCLRRFYVGLYCVFLYGFYGCFLWVGLRWRFLIILTVAFDEAKGDQIPPRENPDHMDDQIVLPGGLRMNQKNHAKQRNLFPGVFKHHPSPGKVTTCRRSHKNGLP